MKKFTGFEHGIGMGGWLTNYKRLQVVEPSKRMWITPGDMEHFASYITRDDVEYIASLGADHIRLGFDQIVLEEFEHPGVYREEILSVMSDFFDWCREFGLNVMFNMHKAIGAYCDVASEMNDLCRDPALRKRFTDCWVMLENVTVHGTDDAPLIRRWSDNGIIEIRDCDLQNAAVIDADEPFFAKSI